MAGPSAQGLDSLRGVGPLQRGQVPTASTGVMRMPATASAAPTGASTASKSVTRPRIGLHYDNPPLGPLLPVGKETLLRYDIRPEDVLDQETLDEMERRQDQAEANAPGSRLV